jgi:hypothetical protein
MMGIGLGLAIVQIPNNGETTPSNIVTDESGLNIVTDESGTDPVTSES